MKILSRRRLLSVGHMLAGVLLSAALSGFYARGGYAYLLGFVAWVPWLRSLDATRTWVGSLLGAYAMTLAYTATVFAWFGYAIGSYTELGAGTGLCVLLLVAPLFQPQLLAFALVRHLAGRRYGPMLRALAGVSAWVATEWCFPKVLGDTLGYGLYPSRLLRQAADLGGAAGLTALLLLTNEGLAWALARRHDGLRVVTRPLAGVALLPLLLVGYGYAELSTQSEATGKPLRMGLIQSNIVHYERLRQEKGAYAVVRDVLDTHFAMSYDAVERQHADAVLWSETAYPTTFGQPKSVEGAEFDQHILSIVKSAGVPFVFGTYDRDAAGEYNAAAFVTPNTGLLGMYRKTRVFPLTEYVPAWLDGPVLRRWLPWAGTWLPGDGARVFPLRLADGREIPVMPSICLDDVDTKLAIQGARLGAQAILNMSNDSWFTDYPQGAELHQAVAAFRSIETRLPQFRVTTNGYSGVIDANGTVVAGARLDERTLVIGEVPVRTPTRTLMVLWGDWVGLMGAMFLVLLAILTVLPALRMRSTHDLPDPGVAMAFPTRVAVLPPVARYLAGMLRIFARGSLLWMCVAISFDETLRNNTLAQIRMFTGLFLLPEAASWCVLLAFAARASFENGKLVLTRGARRLELVLRDIVAVELWRLPIPGAGASLRLRSGNRWGYSFALANPMVLAREVAGTAGTQVQEGGAALATSYAQARLAIRRGRLDHAWVKFILFPSLLAIPAFQLHQHIAYGSAFGEYISFGLKAYLTAFALWWAAWSIGVTLMATALRAMIELATFAAVLLRPAQAIELRRWLERAGRVIIYVGLPAWLLLQIVGG